MLTERTSKNVLIVAGAALAIVLAVGLYAAIEGFGGKGEHEHDAANASSELPPGAVVGGPFQLVDQNGAARSEADLNGHVSLIFFGYTHCPDICPTTLQSLSSALDQLGEKAASVVPIFVTVDPERDTPEALKPYTEAFHPRLIALTGTAEAVQQMASAYKVYYAKGQAAENGSYSMDHSTVIYVMGPEGTLLGTVDPNAPPSDMAAKIASFL